MIELICIQWRSFANMCCITQKLEIFLLKKKISEVLGRFTHLSPALGNHLF